VNLWPVDAKVAVLASGGLSHFVVHEDLDRAVLQAIAQGDEKALRELPEWQLRSGNSEIKNWLVAAAACDHLEFDLIDYVPCRRSAAGTGVGTALAVWS
jgi:hypothetical protein